MDKLRQSCSPRHLIAAALVVACAACTPAQTLLMSLVPDGTIPVLLSHFESVSDINRKRISELEQRKDWDALAKLADFAFDIIVTDIGMPEEDGYSLVRRLRALQSGRQMLAIAVTGYASNSDIEAAMDAGFDLHVPKPVDFNTFVPMVRRLAQK